MTVIVVIGMTMTEEAEDRMTEDKPCASRHLVKPYGQM